jgi:hypothetical protein
MVLLSSRATSTLRRERAVKSRDDPCLEILPEIGLTVAKTKIRYSRERCDCERTTPKRIILNPSLEVLLARRIEGDEVRR